MNKRNKMLLTGAIAVVAIGAGVGTHEVILNQAHHKVTQAQSNLNTQQNKVLQLKQDLKTYENSKPSNIKDKFPSANFQKSKHVLVPIEANFKGNTAKLAQRVVTYINELRQLNHIPTKVSWQANSPEQEFAHKIATNQSVTFDGKYEVAGYQNEGDDESSDTGAGQAESDQEMAYNIVMSLYDQSLQSNFEPNTAGNYSARAFLLYTGNQIGVDASSGAVVAFDYKESSEYEAMLKTASAPKTTPLPDITFDYVDMSLVKKAETKIQAEMQKVSDDEKALKMVEHNENQIKKHFF
ncbi:hypothetical protein ACQUEN_02410 [Lactococcus taiwanensis]|uniref:hypothetical protein n=1 Tax=Lactococcus taiwanensis TaxID=1151742 RepID=UPI003D122B38